MDDALTQLDQFYRDTAPALLGYFRRQPALARAAEDLLQDTSVRRLARDPVAARASSSIHSLCRET